MKRLVLVVWVALMGLSAPAYAGKKLKKPSHEGITVEGDEIHLPSSFKGRYKILTVPHHYQHTEVWCWAASISMVNEFFYKKPIDDCEVTSKIDLKHGGDGKCCNEDEELIDRRCFKPAKADELTEVSEFYFHLHVTEVHRPLAWNELMAELDAGHPLIAGLVFGPGMGHAVVVFGYAEPDVVFIQDPVLGSKAVEYELLKGGHGRHGFWYMTWQMSPSDRTTFGTAAMPPALAQASAGPALSTVTATLPSISGAADRAPVEARVTKELGAIRSCYEQGMKEMPPVAPHATVTVSFALEKGDPSWLRVVEANGVTQKVSRCITDTVARWRGLYPTKGKYEEQQKLHFEFTRADGVPAANPPAVAGHPGSAPSMPPASKVSAIGQ